MPTIRLFFVGDVMLARGIDMILPYHNNPILYEDNGLNAHDYVHLAEKQNGPIPEESKRGVDYIWGDALQILKEKNPDVRIINLETSITTSSSPWPMKGIHYRMHPGNISVIAAAQIDCCTLANNHVADWGFDGLDSTLKTLTDADIKYSGAGEGPEEASSPAICPVQKKGRVLVFAGGDYSSGVPDEWQATSQHSGVNIIDVKYNQKKSISELKSLVAKYKEDDDIAVLSLHWGGNWGFDIDSSFKTFAHKAIDKADIDVIYGHSSHHVKGIEVYNGKVIIYGCGDFLNDYEGISGHEEYHDDLALMYFVDVDSSSGRVTGLQMVPTQTKHLRVNHAPEEGIQWLYNTMKRECKKLGVQVIRDGNELRLTGILK